MTSEEIKSWQESLASGNPSRLSDKGIKLATLTVLAEIAYQFARFNESEHHEYHIPGVDGTPPRA